MLHFQHHYSSFQCHVILQKSVPSDRPSSFFHKLINGYESSKEQHLFEHHYKSIYLLTLLTNLTHPY